MPAGSAAVGRQAVELGLPKDALIVLIGRGSEQNVPDGNTLLARGDHLLIRRSSPRRRLFYTDFKKDVLAAYCAQPARSSWSGAGNVRPDTEFV